MQPQQQVKSNICIKLVVESFIGGNIFYLQKVNDNKFNKIYVVEANRKIVDLPTTTLG